MVVTDMQMMLITPNATKTTISPRLEPTQHSPYSTPERTLS